jgi:hypothetical protein
MTWLGVGLGLGVGAGVKGRLGVANLDDLVRGGARATGRGRGRGTVRGCYP